MILGRKNEKKNQHKKTGNEKGITPRVRLDSGKFGKHKQETTVEETKEEESIHIAGATT